jgi:hypothetical protein
MWGIPTEAWLCFLAIGVLFMSLKTDAISIGTIRTAVAFWLDV